jgi:ribosome biogenesis GTPase
VLERAALDAGASWGVESVRDLVPMGKVGIMLGPSGVGKSTLLNALLGREALQTGAVRVSDGAGRHTTVTRRMVKIPGSGIIVDEPGLRTLQMVGHERGLAMVFPQIADAARACRFRDCTHTHEPGCEVLARFGSGETNERLRIYLSLAAEMRESADTLDPDIVL